MIGHAPDGITAAYLHSSNTIEFAIQLACIHTRRSKILGASASFDHVTTLTVRTPRKYDLLSPEQEDNQCLNSLIALIKDHPDAAAVVVDPLGVSVGLYDSKSIGEDLHAIVELCTTNGIVFIVSETQTFGGYIGDNLFVSNHFDLSPDIICIGQFYGVYKSITLCQDHLKALVDEPKLNTFDTCPLVSPEAISAINFLKYNQMPLDAFQEAAQSLKMEFPKLRIQQSGFFLSVTRQNGEFLENWTKRTVQLALDDAYGLLVKNNYFKSVLVIASFATSSEVIKSSLKKFLRVLQQAEEELEQPSLLYSDIIKRGITPTLLTRIKKRPPVASQWEYVGALLAEIDSTLFVRKIGAKEQAFLVSCLCKAGIPAAEVVVVPDGSPEYAYLPGVSMDMYMVDNIESDPGLINGLVLRHQQYLEMAHDSGLNIPDRWPGNTIIWEKELTLIDFDLVYCQSTGNNDLLFAFEEVCSTFQCVSWIMNPSLQQDMSDRLCLAVITRNSIQLVSQVWKGMVKFYGNPLKPYLPESLSPADYKKGIDAMNTSFAKLSTDVLVVDLSD